MVMILAMAFGPTDDELVRRFKEGDRHAYSEIVRRYQDRVFSQCLRWIGERQVAEEVAQDVFIALFRSLPKFRGDARLSTWIFRVVVNHCKNRRLYRRRRQHGKHEPLEGQRPDDPDAPKRQIADDSPGADAGIHRSEAEELVHTALAHLDDEQRQIVILRDVQDLSYQEISEILGLPRGTVKSRIHRARAQLATLLARRITKEDVV
ncbi:MAG: RNA polymerase sigma-70 factor (ECF subfamily) [Myxococcota bacterium]|jgi:RNA polymerase sigma-70 factor (ECF subfamily)